MNIDDSNSSECTGKLACAGLGKEDASKYFASLMPGMTVQVSGIRAGGRYLSPGIAFSGLHSMYKRL